MMNKSVIAAIAIVVVILALVLSVYFINNMENDDDPDPDPNGDDDVDDDVGDDDDDDIPPVPRPKAVISAPDEAYQFYEVTFDASGSTDPDGQALTYAWDFDKDGFEDANGKTAVWTFEELGRHSITLAIENEDGVTDTESHAIEIVEGTGHPPYENLTIDGGETDTIFRRAVGDSDISKNFDMPNDVIMVETTLTWIEDGWNLKFSIGTGTDPETGSELVVDSSETKSLTIYYSKSDDAYLTVGTWYVNIDIMNPDDHQPVIDQCNFEVGVRVHYETL